MNARAAMVIQSAAVVSVLFCSTASARTPVQSFAALRPVLKPGERVIITDSSGQHHSGKVSSLGDQLQLDCRQRQMLFSEDGIRRIEKGDPNWDGGLIGFGVGLALGLAVAKNESADSEGADVALGVAICVAGPFVGEWVDGRFHRVSSSRRAGRASPLSLSSVEPGLASRLDSVSENGMRSGSLRSRCR